mmetsp:Transcript_11229/g.39821  ORF Transcript_11229/g.39821 Transcript_11229/m.39821 type:complete len:249 (-) Transcript_11229:85-831(-)
MSAEAVRVVRLDGGSLEVRAVAAEDVAAVKAKIFAEHGIAIADQKLLLDGRCLADNESLCDAGILGARPSTLFLLVRRDTAAGGNRAVPLDFEGVIVHALDGGSRFEIAAKSSETVLDLKARLQESSQIPIFEQHLVFGGRELTDDSVLASKGVSTQAGSTVYLLRRQTSAQPSAAFGEVGSRVERRLDGAWFGAVVVHRTEASGASGRLRLVLRYGDDGNLEEGVDVADCRPMPASRPASGPAPVAG